MEYQRYQEWLQRFTTDHTLLYAGHLLARAAQEFPHSTALIMGTEQYSFAALFEQASRISSLLLSLGIKPADRVMLLIENSLSFYTAYYGAWQIGAIVAPLNTFLTAQEIASIVQDANPTLMIHSDTLQEKLADLQDVRSILTSELKQRSESLPPPADTDCLRRLPEQDTCMILYTSGTTGKPKGVMLSSFAIISNLCQALARFNLKSQERVLCPLPLFHSFTQLTCVWGTIASGCCVILLPRINRHTLHEGLAHHPTVVLGVPGLYALFCRLPRITFPTVRSFICGGEPLASNIRLFFALRFGRLLCNGYGLTEAGPLVAADLDDYIKSTHTIGLPVVALEYELRDADEAGGVLWVRGPNIMNGYYNAPEATQKVLQNGWLNTGDIVKLDAQNNFVIGGREKDIIVQKGIKIYPQEIETVLTTHPTVALAAVLGKPDPHTGEFPIAYVQPLPETAISEDILRQYCQARLAQYKVPRQIIVVNQLPLTPTGKVDKKQLRLRADFAT